MKAICEKGMVKHFKKDNIFEILNLADRFNAKNIKVEKLVCLRMYVFLHYALCCCLSTGSHARTCSQAYCSIPNASNSFYIGRCVEVHRFEFHAEKYPFKQRLPQSFNDTSKRLNKTVWSWPNFIYTG